MSSAREEARRIAEFYSGGGPDEGLTGDILAYGRAERKRAIVDVAETVYEALDGTPFDRDRVDAVIRALIDEESDG